MDEVDNLPRAALQVEDLSKHFGGLQALEAVNLSIAPGERQALIGPNGAGKSTLFNLITGELEPSAGKIFINGVDISTLSVYQRARLGLGHTFQRNNLFPNLTVRANVQLAYQPKTPVNRRWFTNVDKYPTLRQGVADILETVKLTAAADRLVSALAYGQQRALEIGLALATEPKIVLFDEPTAGMSPAETAEVVALIRRLPPALTILIVEHDMDVIFSLASRITVLHHGAVVRKGTPAEVRQDKQVQALSRGKVNGEITRSHTPEYSYLLRP